MLYIVSTPIGNIKEITYRAVEVLGEVDVILCEDTRHSRVLLDHYGIKKQLVSYQKFNERERVQEIISMLDEGKNIALISDAGMPVISDPGWVLVSELARLGYEYTVVSGPCALVNAMVLSALDATRFCMVGFLPEKQGERRKLIQKFAKVEASLIFYCPVHDIDDYLKVLGEELGERKCAVVREISKMYEQVTHITLTKEYDIVKKGEFVLVVEGAKSEGETLSELSIEEHIKVYLRKGLSEKDAVKAVASDRKIAKSIVYAEALKMKENKDE